MNEKEKDNLIKLLIGIILAIILGIGGFYIYTIKSQIKKLEKEKTEQSEKVKREVELKISEGEKKSQEETNPVQEENKENKEDVVSGAVQAGTEQNRNDSDVNERLIVRKPIEVRKGSYCEGVVPSKSYFNTSSVYDPLADHPFMADVYFKDCVIYGKHSTGEYKGIHTGPLTMTVSLAEEKNFRAVMKRNKWYLENGELMRIEGVDFNHIYFNGWLMYKQTQ